MSKASSIVKTVLGLIIGLAFVGAGVFALLYVLNEEPAAPSKPSGQVEPEPEVDVLEPKSFPEYTWTELGLIADLIEAAPDEASGRAIAQEYGLIDADGRLATSTHLIVIEGGMTVEARLVGILHDTRADGQGRAALTFQVFPIAVRRFNPTASSTGGWQGSELRAWLAQDGMALLPPELSGRILPVRKSTDNTGKTDSIASPYGGLILQVQVNGHSVAPGTCVSINSHVKLTVGDGSIENLNPDSILDQHTIDSIEQRNYEQAVEEYKSNI